MNASQRNRRNARYSAIVIAGFAALTAGCHVAAKLDFCATVAPEELIAVLGGQNRANPAGAKSLASGGGATGHHCASDLCPFEGAGANEQD